MCSIPAKRPILGDVSGFALEYRYKDNTRSKPPVPVLDVDVPLDTST